MTETLLDDADDGTGEDALSFFEALDQPAPNLEDEAEVQSLAMFEGDTGTLYPEQRRCLHALLKQRYISADRHPEQWATLVADQDLIKSRLNDLYLELHIDREYQVAFKRQARTETGDRLPSLLNDLAHQKEETIVMIHLRQRFFAQRQENDDAVFVDRQSLLDEVASQRPEHATDRAMDQKRADKAIENLNTAGVILKTGDPDRFRISPIIEVLMPIEKLRALLAWFMAQNGTDAGAHIDIVLDADGGPGQLFEMEESE
ncbi:DUF4194 domain-containing protein [Populibacterium corticicola]|uniref:DUF4194 domain-containing protein n=1 Tax=Populibacterium corticicola TaxID=1812826 RepID=A0ABW5XDJ0_9MICO